MRYIFGDYSLDPQRRELRCRGHLVPLQPHPMLSCMSRLPSSTLYCCP